MKKLFQSLKNAFSNAVLNGLVAIFLILPTIVSVISICFSYVAKFFYLAIKSQTAIIHFLTHQTIYKHGKDYGIKSLQRGEAA